MPNNKTKAPLRKPDVDIKKLDQFASQVEVKQSPQFIPPAVLQTARYPWEDPWVRSDVVKGMGVPLSEPYLLKLRFVAEHTKWSQRKFCQAKIEEAIDKEVEAIIKALNSDTYQTRLD